MTKKYVFSLFVLFAQLLSAQQSRVDSLSGLWVKAQNDISRADLLNEIADGYKSVNPSKIPYYANQALSISRKIGYKSAEGKALLNLANYHIISGNYAKALDVLDAAQTLFEKEKEAGNTNKAIQLGLAKSYGTKGIVFSEQSNYARALSQYFQSLKIYESLDDNLMVSRICNNIGIAYQSQGEHFKALSYFVRCMKLQEKQKDGTAAVTTTNIGNLYLARKDTAKAVSYYAKAEKLFMQYPDARGEGELYNNLGRAYLQPADKTKALAYFAKAERSFAKIQDKFGVADTYYFMAGWYLSAGKTDAAIAYANQSLALAKVTQVPEQMANAERILSDAYEKKGNTREAFRHFKAYSAVKDSIESFQNTRNSVAAELNYEYEKKEAIRLKEQEKREVLYREQNHRHRIEIVFTLLLALLVFSLMFLFYNRRQLKKNLTLQKDLAEYEQKALHLQMNPHFVFNCLGSISSFIVQNGQDSAIKYLSKFSKLMRLTLEYSKEALIPIDKEIESLQNYLELEQLRFNRKFEFEIVKSADIEDDMALPPLLLQPFVENAIIHGVIPKGTGGFIKVTFDLDNETLVCTVIDNGVGFKKSQEIKEKTVQVHKSMALDITKKRLEMMEAMTSKTAQVHLEETKDEQGNISGTRVLLKIPIQYTKK